MRFRTSVTAAGFLVALALVAEPVVARAADQDQARTRRQSQAGEQRAAPARRAPAPAPQARERAVPRSQAPSRPEQVTPRQTPQAPRGAYSNPRGEQQTPRRYEAPRGPQTPRPYEAPRTYEAPRRYEAPRYETPRGYGDRTPAPRSYPTPRAYAAPRGYAVPRGSVAPRGIFIAPRVTHFARPYYSFRPQFRLSFGLYVGYPVVYPWRLFDPFAYSGYDRYWYGGYISTSRSSYGGLSFDIQPYDAAVYVDGLYVGTVDDFSNYGAPLTLAIGLHHIDLTAYGYQPMSFDITVVGGQVIPYQGALAPLR